MNLTSNEIENKFKDILSPIIYVFFSNINKDIEQGKISGIDKNNIIVVGGGEALNLYIDNIEITKTHDFDCRIIPKDQQAYMFSNSKEKLEIGIYKSQDYIANELIKNLNYLLNLRGNSLLKNSGLEKYISSVHLIDKNTYESDKNDGLSDDEIIVKLDFILKNEETIFFIKTILDDFNKPEKEKKFNDSFEIFFFRGSNQTPWELMVDYKNPKIISERYYKKFDALVPIIFYYKIDLNFHSNALIDLFPVTKKDVLYLGFENEFSNSFERKLEDPDEIIYFPSNVREFINYQTPYMKNFYQHELFHRIQLYDYKDPKIKFYDSKYLRHGYFRKLINYTTFQRKHLYVITLGFLVWDTVRMLNFKLSKVEKEFDKFKKEYPALSNKEKVEVLLQIDSNQKFERYLQKYLAIINALSNVKENLSCDSMEEFVKNCNQGKLCQINNVSINKNEVINKYKEKYKINEDNEELKTIPFKVLCESLDGKVVNKIPTKTQYRRR